LNPFIEIGFATLPAVEGCLFILEPASLGKGVKDFVSKAVAISKREI